MPSPFRFRILFTLTLSLLLGATTSYGDQIESLAADGHVVDLFINVVTNSSSPTTETGRFLTTTMKIEGGGGYVKSGSDIKKFDKVIVEYVDQRERTRTPRLAGFLSVPDRNPSSEPQVSFSREGTTSSWYAYDSASGCAKIASSLKDHSLKPEQHSILNISLDYGLSDKITGYLSTDDNRKVTLVVNYKSKPRTVRNSETVLSCSGALY